MIAKIVIDDQDGREPRDVPLSDVQLSLLIDALVSKLNRFIVTDISAAADKRELESLIREFSK